MNKSEILDYLKANQDARGIAHWNEQAETQVEQLQGGYLAQVFSSCDATLAKTSFVVDLADQWIDSIVRSIMIRKIFLPLTASIAMLGGTTAYAQSDDMSTVMLDKDEGCMTGEMAQFGRYIGNWIITSEERKQDGTWSPASGAMWNFKCVGNGIAVQDFWMPNGVDGGPPPGVGTNLRIYDKEKDHWDITWTATRTPGFSHIRAKQAENGNIIMSYVQPQQNPDRRITFFPPTDEGWDWQLEMTFDQGKTWLVVYTIKATAAPD